MILERGLVGFVALVSFALAPTGREAEPQLRLRPRTPNLVAPDKLERAPIIVVTEDRAELDGQSMTLDELEKMLRLLFNNYKLLHPIDAFNGTAIIACAPETTSHRLGQVLQRMAATGYPKPAFLFIAHDVKTGDQTRPEVITVAEATTSKKIHKAKRGKKVALQLHDYADCLSFSRALIDHRKQESAVLIELDRGRAGPR